jgi:hypothetical protein
MLLGDDEMREMALDHVSTWDGQGGKWVGRGGGGSKECYCHRDLGCSVGW